MSNVYTLENVQRATGCWETDDGFAFSYEDHGISRLSFLAADRDALSRLLDEVPAGCHHLEIMTKDGEAVLPGLRRVTRLKRLVNSDCRSVFDDSTVLQYRDDAVGEAALPQDAHEINRLLWSVFRTEVSHLLWDDELEGRIRDGQISIHRGNGIDAVLMADVMPRKFYINQIVNMGEKRNIHAMLLNRLWRFVEGGGRYLYAWVEEDNAASIKFHGKYGMKHDGMWNVLWLLER